MKSLVTLVLISFFLSAAFQATEALRCHTCVNTVCSTMVCEPQYERCFTGTSTVDGQTTMAKGCATKALCDATQNSDRMSCCDWDFCNSAEGVKLSLFIMLASLISSILFI